MLLWGTKLCGVYRGQDSDRPCCYGRFVYRWYGSRTCLEHPTHLNIPALGISDEVEKLGLKGSKKRKSKKLDEDYAPILKPLQEKDVPKVIQAIRQTSSRKVLSKLLTRIKVNDQCPLGAAVVKHVSDHGGQVAAKAADEVERIQLDDEYPARLFL